MTNHRDAKVYTLRGMTELMEILDDIALYGLLNCEPYQLAMLILDNIHDWDWNDDYGGDGDIQG